MLLSMRKSVSALAALVVFGFAAPSVHAQDIDVDGSLGNYYQNLYVQTHIYGALTRHGGRRTVRAVRHVHASPVWSLSPDRSAAVSRMVASAPPASRPASRAALSKVLGAYPAIVRLAGKSEGVMLHPADVRDTATLAGVMSYQCLIGHDLSRAQFLAERSATVRWFADHDLTPAQVQQTGDTYAMAICLMPVLKAYENNPQNKDPELTRRQLHQLALNTFRTGYQSADYTKFAATSRGIVKVSN